MMTGAKVSSASGVMMAERQPVSKRGVIATKGYLTYWTGAIHAPGVDANFTAFHILK